MRRTALLLLAATGCSSQPIAKPEQKSAGTGTEQGSAAQYRKFLEYLETPQYGATRDLKGVVLIRFETNAIALCDTGRSRCTMPTNVDGSSQPCWLERKEGVALSLPVPDGESTDAQFWIEGSGRIAVHPGNFGHLGSYTCQVELTRLDRFDADPPLVFDRPPYG